MVAVSHEAALSVVRELSRNAMHRPALGSSLELRTKVFRPWLDKWSRSWDDVAAVMSQERASWTVKREVLP